MDIKQSKMLINGILCSSKSGEAYSLFSPVDGSQVAEIPEATIEDVEMACEAAHQSFHDEWKTINSEEKRKLFANLEISLNEFANEIHSVKVLPLGGPEIPPLVHRLIDFYVGKLDEPTCELLEQGDTGSSYIMKEPLGVVAIFVPFNGPLLGTILAAIPALIAGNTIVVKAPVQEAPQALKVLEAFNAAGFPPGVVNILSGKEAEVGKALAEHPLIRLISFTGNTATGKKIMASASNDLKRLQLNLGSKTVQIVYADADISKAVNATITSAYPGQACSAISRVLVHRSVREEFLKLLELRAMEGSPCLLIDQSAIRRIERYVDLGKKTGELLFGGRKPVDEMYARGCYFEPTCFLFKDQSSPVCRDEIFGPVLSVIEFDDDKKAIELANDTEFGLLASIWTTNPKIQQFFVSRLETGIVGVNNNGGLNYRTPWGGFKQSGIGRRYGQLGLDVFYECKTIWSSS